MRGSVAIRLEKAAAELRKLTVYTLARSGRGHPGGSLSVVEILAALFFGVFESPEGRRTVEPRFVLSKGHADAAYYSVLCMKGIIEKNELQSMGVCGSRLQAHPDVRFLPQVMFSGGSLGQGLSFALGQAIALRSVGRRVFVVIGDGELQEGQIWEAVLSASSLELSNLTVVVDCNGYQLAGPIPATQSARKVAAAWRCLGWSAKVVDGHDVAKIARACRQNCGKPSVVFALTIKGKGVPFMEGDNDFHGRALTLSEAHDATAAVGVPGGR